MILPGFNAVTLNVECEPHLIMMGSPRIGCNEIQEKTARRLSFTSQTAHVDGRRRADIRLIPVSSPGFAR
jgi:hypothetical protein